MFNLAPRPVARARWPHWLAAGLLILGCAATVVLCLWLRSKALTADRARLHEEAEMQMETVDTRIELFVEMLQRFQDQITRTPELDAAHWDGLVRELNLLGNYPGLAAVGFWLYQPPEAPSRWQNAWQAIGLRSPHHTGWYHEGRLVDSFHSLVKSSRPESYETISTSGVFVPDEALWTGIDWNVGVGPGALPGQDVMDGRSDQPDRGFRILLPVFYPERHPRALVRKVITVATNNPGGVDLITQNDWGNLRGILYGEFAMKQFVASTLGRRPRGVEFVVYDVQADWHENPSAVFRPIYGDPNAPGEKHYLEERLEMKHYGRRLVFDFHTTPAFLPHSLRRWPLIAALIGGAATLLVAGLAASQTRARLREQADADRLRAANETLAAALHDRERISRELHDGALQSIYALGLGLAHCRNISATQPERVSELLAESMNSIDAVVAELRQFLLGLEVDLLAGGSLEPMLRAMARRLEATTSTRVLVHADAAVANSLPTRDSVHLMNLVREAVSNAIRHGEPTEVKIILVSIGGGWRLEIHDDGCGFDTERVPGAAGHGLRNMRARAAELGASFVLESRPGSGTMVRVECGAVNS